MTTMLETVIPKSDQLNADDLMGGQTKIIKITSVSIAMGEQPVAIHYEGDGGKPYRPGKSMRRVLINCWGADANKYVGRFLTLYRDDKVKFGGVDVGGIRISHMSDIAEPITMALTTTRANRKPFTVKPLTSVVATPTPTLTDDEWVAELLSTLNEDGLKYKFIQAQVALQGNEAGLKKITLAKDARKKELAAAA